MIPIRDTIQSRHYPLINNAIIALNILVYLLQAAHGGGSGRFLVTYGLVPARYSVTEIAAHFTLGQQILSFFSFMFLHGGFWHILGNMWSLYIFGDNVEDRLGSLRYLVFYLLCGVASGIAHVVLNLHSTTPVIGASGAIAGVMGSYFLLYPRARILTLIPIFFIPYFLELPAFIFLGIWFLIQAMSAAGSAAQGPGIAWWAHVGGFLFGMAFLKAFLSIPETSMGRKLRGKTPSLHVIRTNDYQESLDRYGTLSITPGEALSGTRKVVHIQQGGQKRMIRVTVPPGVRSGTNLRLEGMGREDDSGRVGDLYLSINIT